MKNIFLLKGLTKYNSCKINGFFCYTSSGADYHKCPSCGQIDLSDKTSKFKFLYENEYNNDMRNEYFYCSSCKIIYNTGCIHNMIGCTDNIYNAHFIK